MKNKKDSANTERQRLREEDFIRLLKYLKETSKLIGKKKAMGILEKLVAEKRLNWLKENKCRLNLKMKNSISFIDKVFYKRFYKLAYKDREVVKKNKYILVTRWFNYCPVLEACKALDLDTREICRNIYHKPNQIFLSEINPKLKFKRNYNKIRPHANYCEEIIEFKR